MENRIPGVTTRDVRRVLANPGGNRGDLVDQSQNASDSQVRLKVLTDQAAEAAEAKVFLDRKARRAGLEDICKDCGGEISPVRRAALPFTLVCKDCKERAGK